MLGHIHSVKIVCWNATYLLFYTRSIVKNKSQTFNLIDNEWEQYKLCHFTILLCLDVFMFPWHAASPTLDSTEGEKYSFSHLFSFSLGLAPQEMKMKM